MLNPLYFLIAINLLRRLHWTDIVWGNCIAAGVLVGLVSVVCGLLGPSPRRWPLIVAACGETFVWWFMAVGL